MKFHEKIKKGKKERAGKELDSVLRSPRTLPLIGEKKKKKKVFLAFGLLLRIPPFKRHFCFYDVKETKGS